MNKLGMVSNLFKRFELNSSSKRLEILKIHAGQISKHGEIDYEAIVKLSDNFNGADLRNVCTEAGLFAIR